MPGRRNIPGYFGHRHLFRARIGRKRIAAFAMKAKETEHCGHINVVASWVRLRLLNEGQDR